MPKLNPKKRQERNLMRISAIDEQLATRLRELGFVTVERLKDASDEQLLAVPSLNASKLQAIRDYCAGV